jgi:hypothetical protein
LHIDLFLNAHGLQRQKAIQEIVNGVYNKRIV